jgi:hypothetical protein
MNEVARTTYDAAQKQAGFLQIPAKVVGGAAPADCLAGKACVGDARMAALSSTTTLDLATLAQENERLPSDASGTRATGSRQTMMLLLISLPNRGPR